MWERFTERAKHVVSNARQEAMRLGSESVHTEHVLLGICLERECVAAQALENLGVDIESLATTIEEQAQRGDTVVSGEGIAFTPRAKKVLELAVEESRKSDNSCIATEHILLGLVREGDGIAAKTLQDMNVNRKRVLHEVEHLISDRCESHTDLASIPQPSTKPSKQIIRAAMHEADQRGDKYLRAEHILFAICADSDCAAAHVLAVLGADIAALTELSRDPSPRLAILPPKRWGRYAPDVHQILEFAVEEAFESDRGYLGTEHVLLALTRSIATPVVQALNDAGIQYNGVKDGIAQLLETNSLPNEQ